MVATFLVQADGGSRGNPGPAAYGTVISDPANGQTVAELAEFFDHATNNFAEYRGAIAGLEYVHSIDASARIEVRLDSKLVVEQMSGRWKIKNDDIRKLALRARDAHDPTLVEYVWVPRADNARADALVNEMLNQALGGGATTIHRGIGGNAEDVVGEAQESEVQAELFEAIAEEEPPRTMIGWASLGSPTTLLLARHGATAYSLEKRFSGTGGVDLPLIELGQQQGAALAREIGRRGEATRIVTSPLLRAQQTAELIAAEAGLPVEIDALFTECSFGEWDGYTFAEVREKWPEEMADWLASTSVAPPGGESFDSCQGRVRQGLRGLLDRYPGETIVLVGHVTPIKLLVTDAVGAPVDSVYRMELPPCSISKLAWFSDGNSSMFSFAEAAHLHDLRGPAGS
ncbi:MAG: bifunctional RNase H/acid phosphatase [Actinomycetota bacterium]|nr:bifunctional RNase H/acid phosphatase [Actinomycetota bacterium]